jgi:5-hydroxyisourate hydrolase
MITTHVLDTSRGGAAVGIAVTLEVREALQWNVVGNATTDANGRATTLMHGRPLAAGEYRLTFDTAAYHRQQGVASPFFSHVVVTFCVTDAAGHYHVPLLLSPFGYSTYRGT